MSHNTLGPWMHAGDAAEPEDVPHFSEEEEEETMSQTGRPMTDQEMEELGIPMPKDDMDDDDVENLEESNVEESEEEEEHETAELYLKKYGVMKPPPCPKQMPQMGGRMRPPEPPGPPPGRAAVEPKPAELKPAEPKPAGQKPKLKPAEPAVPPPPPGPPPAGVTTVQWTQCTKTMAVLPPPPPPAAAHSSTSSSSRPCEAVVPYDEDDEYELDEEPDPQSTTSTAMVKWKQPLGS